MKPKCLITGCDVFATNLVCYARADLHQLGEAYLLVCVTDQSGRVDWRPLFFHGRTDTRRVTLDTNNTFERGSLVVVNVRDAVLSDEAVKYINKWEA